MSKRTAKDPAKQFIESKSKWVRVLAGPGAGKSFCLKERLKYLVTSEKVKPEKILVLTFTSVAAQDLQNDIKALSKKNPDLGLDKVVVTTLHALALEQLKQENKGKRWMLDFEKDTMLRDLEPEIGKFRRQSALLKQCAKRAPGAVLSDEERKFEGSLKKWQEQHHGLVLNELISDMCEYLSGNKAARRRLCFSRVLVDEYQDLNPDEQQYVELLTAEGGKLTVIGDDDQSIYGFKGASSAGIRNFAKEHSNCEDILFPECRRCPTEIIEKANALIGHSADKRRIIKQFVPYVDKKDGSHNQQGTIRVCSFETPEEELDGLAQIIRQENMDIASALSKDKEAESGEPNAYGQIVVLSATKDRGKKLQKELANVGIPTTFCFRGSILDNKVVQENLSLLTLAGSPDDLISWRYLLGFGNQSRNALSYKRIRDYANANRLDPLQVLDQCASGETAIPYIAALVKRYKEIHISIESIRADPNALLNRLGPNEQEYANILRRQIIAKWDMEGPRGVRDAVLDEVFSPEAAASSDRVRIMSLHAAKGLSAKLVIIMSAINGLIPLEGKDIEEQRRLFYVAITRCKGSKDEYPGMVVISSFTHSEDGTVEYELSRFVEEMNR